MEACNAALEIRPGYPKALYRRWARPSSALDPAQVPCKNGRDKQSIAWLGMLPCWSALKCTGPLLGGVVLLLVPQQRQQSHPQQDVITSPAGRRLPQFHPSRQLRHAGAASACCEGICKERSESLSEVFRKCFLRPWPRSGPTGPDHLVSAKRSSCHPHLSAVRLTSARLPSGS